MKIKRKINVNKYNYNKWWRKTSSVNMTSKTKCGEGNKKCRSFRMCLNLRDYLLRQVYIVIGQHIWSPLQPKQKPTTDTQNMNRNTRVPLKKTIKLLGKKTKEEELTGKNYKNNWETSNKLEIKYKPINNYDPNVSGLNTPMKRHRVGDWIIKGKTYL